MKLLDNVNIYETPSEARYIDTGELMTDTWIGNGKWLVNTTTSTTTQRYWDAKLNKLGKLTEGQQCINALLDLIAKGEYRKYTKTGWTVKNKDGTYVAFKHIASITGLVEIVYVDIKIVKFLKLVDIYSSRKKHTSSYTSSGGRPTQLFQVYYGEIETLN